MLPCKTSDSVTYAKPRSRPTLSSELSPASSGWPRSSSERVSASQIPAPPCGHVPASGRTPEAGAESMGLRDRADSSSFCPVLGCSSIFGCSKTRVVTRFERGITRGLCRPAGLKPVALSSGSVDDAPVLLSVGTRRIRSSDPTTTRSPLTETATSDADPAS